MTIPHRIVIVGGGFAGLHAAKALRRSRADVTLIDRRNFHLFQPLLYQVATGGLSPADISTPIRALLRTHSNTRVVLGSVTDIDVDARIVRLSDGGWLPYDTLVLAAGSVSHYYGRDEWANSAFSLKTIEDAVEIRRRVLTAFEAAESAADGRQRRPWLTFAIVGGGPTGVEMAGAIGELATGTLKDDFRSFRSTEARILLFEGGNTILSGFGYRRREAASRALARLGVTVVTNSKVTDVSGTGLTVVTRGNTRRIPARTVIWAAGVRASGVGKLVASAARIRLASSGQVIVEPDFSLPGRPEIFAIGDLAWHSHHEGEPLPATADVAIAEGKYVGRSIARMMVGKRVPPFRFRPQGKLAVIGRSAAVAELGPLNLTGWSAWLAWLFIHLLKLVEYENRVLVAIQWGWSYATRNRSARLITVRPRSHARVGDGSILGGRPE